MKLSQLAIGRNNNFNLIRIAAAVAVLVSHSFSLVGVDDPLIPFVGMSAGDVGVDIFFLASGFLVTASLIARNNVREFLLARALRVFPALVVMVLLSVLLLGPAMTTLPIPEYFESPQTRHYLLKCISLFDGVEYHLPGVFEQNPLRAAVNGSLWSLPVEVRMYAALALIWTLFAVFGSFRGNAVKLVTAGLAVTAGVLVVRTHLSHGDDSASLRLIFMFFTGSAYFSLRQAVRFSGAAFGVLTCALVFTAVSRPAFYITYMVTIGYLLFYLAYVPGGSVRRYNQVGDYSYGVYIYAFPVQQTVVSFAPAISPLLLALAAGVTTLGLSFLSWNLIERRAMAIGRARQSKPLVAGGAVQ